MQFSDAASKILETLGHVADAERRISPTQAMVALANLDQTRSALAYALNEDYIWAPYSRDKCRRRVAPEVGGAELIDAAIGTTEARLVRAAEARAHAAGTESVREWHVAEALVE